MYETTFAASAASDGLTLPSLPAVPPATTPIIQEPVTPPAFAMPIEALHKENAVPLLDFPCFWLIGPDMAPDSTETPRAAVYSLESAPSFAFDAWLSDLLTRSQLVGLLRAHRVSWPLIERWEAVQALARAGVEVRRCLFGSRSQAQETLNFWMISQQQRKMEENGDCIE